MRAGEPLLVIDLDAVSFLDAAGLEVLADAASLADRRGNRISIRGATAAFEDFGRAARSAFRAALRIGLDRPLPGRESP